jgi:phosphoribosylformylglycinamidine cyclo-ligase
MLKTFNCGIGMAVMLPENQTQTAIDLLAEHGETAVRIGTVERSDVQQPQVQYV